MNKTCRLEHKKEGDLQPWALGLEPTLLAQLVQSCSKAGCSGDQLNLVD